MIGSVHVIIHIHTMLIISRLKNNNNSNNSGRCGVVSHNDQAPAISVSLLNNFLMEQHGDDA